MEVVFNAARSSSASKGALMERYYRDCAMYRSHISSQHLNFAAPIGALTLLEAWIMGL